jgi:hypothetical protein
MRDVYHEGKKKKEKAKHIKYKRVCGPYICQVGQLLAT